MNMDSRKKSILLIVLVVGIISVTIAFAAFSANLRINGTASIGQTTWNVDFASFSEDLTPQTTSLNEPNTGEIKSVSTSDTSITNLVVDLKKPGDNIVYSFNIVNDGSIDAKLSSSSSSKNCNPQSACANLTYTVECRDPLNNVISDGYRMQTNSSISCKLTLLYNTDANIEDDITASVTASWAFIQY